LNFSAKRAYFSGYDNTTQNFLNTANAQVMNVSNTVIDAHGVTVTNRQNISFDSTGDYLIYKIIASRDIEPNEEITIYYGEEYDRDYELSVKI
jgi:hypothetical protein